MKIGIVGTRRRNQDFDYAKVKETFDRFFRDGDTIVSGGCPKGGDKFAEWIAKEKGLTITIHFPDWEKYGKSAGFIRNTKIAEDCDILIAMVADDRTGGTEDTIKKAEKLGKEIIIV